MDGIFDLLPDAAFCVDRGRMTFTELNRAACECLGYTARNCWEWARSRLCPARGRGGVGPAIRRRCGQRAGHGHHSHRRADEGRADGARRMARGADLPVWGRAMDHRGPSTHGPFRQTGPVPSSTAESLGLGKAGHDPLTGLPDRRLFERRLEQALERARERSDYLFAVASSTWTASRRLMIVGAI